MIYFRRIRLVASSYAQARSEISHGDRGK